LHGSRRTLARVCRDDGNFDEYVLEDHWDIPQGWRYLNEEDRRVAEILRTREWTGVTEYAKATVPEIFPDTGSHASSSSGINAAISKAMATVQSLPTGPAELSLFNGSPDQFSVSLATGEDVANPAKGSEDFDEPEKTPKPNKNGEVDANSAFPNGTKAKGGNAVACLEAEGRMISDGLVNPCLQECEHNVYGNMYTEIETQRSRLEELACFEREVNLRTLKRQEREAKPCEREEAACIAALRGQ